MRAGVRWFLVGFVVGAVLVATLTGANIPRLIEDGIEQVTNTFKPKPRPLMEWRIEL